MMSAAKSSEARMKEKGAQIQEYVKDVRNLSDSEQEEEKEEESSYSLSHSSFSSASSSA